MIWIAIAFNNYANGFWILMLHGSCMDPAFGREFTHPQNSLLIRFNTWFFWYLKLLETWERKNFRTFHQPPHKTDVICLPLMRGFVMMGLHHRVFHLRFITGPRRCLPLEGHGGEVTKSTQKRRKAECILTGGLVHLWLGGGFKYYLFSALLGKDSHFDDHIFQTGWFNHQLHEIVCWTYFVRDTWTTPHETKINSSPPEKWLFNCPPKKEIYFTFQWFSGANCVSFRGGYTPRSWTARPLKAMMGLEDDPASESWDGYIFQALKSLNFQVAASISLIPWTLLWV